MAEDLGRLSPEQLQKLAGVISEVKSLTGQQEEIIEKVLKGEMEVGNLRISSLKEYFDIYSKNLDQIARKYSALNDAYLILDKKLTDSYKTLASNSSSSADEPKASKNSTKSTESQNGLLQEILAVLRAGAVSQESDPRKLLENIQKNNALDPSTLDTLQTAIREAFQTIREDVNNLGVDLSNLTNYATNSSSGGTDNGEASDGSVRVNNTIEEDDRAKLAASTQDLIKFLDQVANKDASLTADSEITNRRKDNNKEQLKNLTDEADKVNKAILDLTIARLDAELMAREENALSEEELAARELLTAETRLAKLKDVTAAELEAQKFLNSLASEIALASEAGQIDTKSGKNYNEAGELRARESTAKDELNSAKALAEQKAKFIAAAELKAKRANNGVLSKEEATRIQKAAAEKFKADKENLDKLTKLRQDKEAKERSQAGDAAVHAAVSGPLTKENNLLKRFNDLKDLATDEAGDVSGKAAVAVALKAISDLAAQLNDKIDQIGKYQGAIDTRLQGSNSNETNYAGSYWGQLTKDMMSVGAVTPFFKQEDFANNIKSLVEKGISFDLKQRAFLMTIQEKIANTFNVADGTLLRLVRIQQEDSTAGRLGMESALNSFLNEMYETTEYLTDVATSVRGSLEEMEALMEGAAATEVEYQVQKWMGSLYSVGMSQSAVQSISTALGQIASGQVEALTNGGAGNLLVMAANDANIPIADILAGGLDAEETNKLLQATVNYLAEIAESSKGNNVVQQQLANVFGVKASDLKAATNLAVAKDEAKYSIQDIFNEYKSYDNLIDRLNLMAGSMHQRTSIGEMMANVWENGQYTLASSMANNPIAYLTYKMAGLLESATGGINLPFISALGNGVDLNTTVADLMRVASISTGIIGSIGPMISGLSSSFSGQAMLSKMGIEAGSGLKITPRGGEGVGAEDNLLEKLNSGGNKTTSDSGYVGNSSGSDIKNSTLQEAEDTKKQLMIEAKEEAEDTPVNIINMNVLKLYELLDDVAHGRNSLSVKVESYGLTKANSASSLSSAQGGVDGLINNSTAADGTLSGGFTSGSGTMGNSGAGNNTGGSSSGYGAGSRVDLGGWIMT